MKLVNFYFRKPLFWDFVISLSFALLVHKLTRKKVIEVPDHDFILSSVSDIANISFSSTGFILTILTVLITFKASSRRKDKIGSYDSALDFFFQTPLYAQTTCHLKNCIKSLVVLGLVGYIFKVVTPKSSTDYLFCFLIFSLFVLALQNK